jgi:TrmH family RNA methyltransferase
VTPDTVRPEVRPLSRAKRKIFADLGTRNGRERRGLFRLEGPRAIEDAMARGARFRSLVVGREGERWIERWAREGRLDGGVEIYGVGDHELAALADTATPQGVVAIGSLPTLTPGDLPTDLGRVALLVDGVQDPGNLGTLLRTLAAVGGRAALLCRGTVDPYNPRALRGAAGATFGIAIAAGLTRRDAVELLAARGARIVALVAGAPSLFEAALPDPPLALAVGNEAAGLGAEIGERAALVAGLPMAPGVESLSAAVAGSVALYALTHRLEPAVPGPDAR